MTGARYGGIGTRVLFENERVRVWEMRLAPGKRSALHVHENDYVMVQISGDKIAADIDSASPPVWGDITHLEADVDPGLAIWGRRGGVETAYNPGQREFYEIIVELKD